MHSWFTVHCAPWYDRWLVCPHEVCPYNVLFTLFISQCIIMVTMTFLGFIKELVLLYKAIVFIFNVSGIPVYAGIQFIQQICYMNCIQYIHRCLLYLCMKYYHS